MEPAIGRGDLIGDNPLIEFSAFCKHQPQREGLPHPSSQRIVFVEANRIVTIACADDLHAEIHGIDRLLVLLKGAAREGNTVGIQCLFLLPPTVDLLQRTAVMTTDGIDQPHVTGIFVFAAKCCGTHVRIFFTKISGCCAKSGCSC